MLLNTSQLYQTKQKFLRSIIQQYIDDQMDEKAEKEFIAYQRQLLHISKQNKFEIAELTKEIIKLKKDILIQNEINNCNHKYLSTQFGTKTQLENEFLVNVDEIKKKTIKQLELKKYKKITI